VPLAKELATIDAVAGGRMILGVGAGWMAEEFDAVDVGMEDRFSRMDEHLELMRAAWQQGVSEHHGRYYSHVKAGFGPQPPGEGNTIPLVVGGHGDAALRRAARYGDGWAVSASGRDMAERGAQVAIRDRLDTLSRLCDDAGRSIDDLLLVSQAFLGESVDTLKGQADLGIDVVDLISFGQIDDVLDQAARFIDEVAPQFA
jgi:alkanesulfonate monooxygenase SsuD/methylene tetrahydromethanopterin reductase-like flavin-dependent oxidoreductase (luciferase family)